MEGLIEGLRDSETLWEIEGEILGDPEGEREGLADTLALGEMD